MSKTANEIIAKSLEDIDNIIGLFKANADITKGGNTGDKLAPEDVSNDAPADDADTADADASGATDGNDAVDDAGDDANTDADDSDADTDDAANDEDDDNTQKSLAPITGSESVKKALEVSEFLRDLVQGISEVIANQGAELNKSLVSGTATQDLLAKSFQGIAKSQRVVLETQATILKSFGELAKSNEDLQKSVNRANNRLVALEGQPLVRKSLSTVPAKVIEKSFGADNGTGNNLSKSQASDILYKAVEGGNKGVMNDLLAFDSTGDFNVLSHEGKQLLGIK
jgi:hypothetical protein